MPARDHTVVPAPWPATIFAIVDGEATVKRFQRGAAGRAWLVPVTAGTAPVAGDNVLILGKVVGRDARPFTSVARSRSQLPTRMPSPSGATTRLTRTCPAGTPARWSPKGGLTDSLYPAIAPHLLRVLRSTE